jgi:methyltransferase-like protein/2-polyprenyl-3-methyl-5-hydroxy-6-metoxy-1,4-benzoquinol methylase
MQEQTNAYDQVSYASRAFPQTHPDRLATLATLFGLQPPPIAQCRVLELGCGDGSNLLPMAYALPGSHFVGIDLAATAIARGQALSAALRLDNISLQAMDVVEIGADLGQFDYIIAHGLFSWVPAPVQDKILALCQQHLAPHGVAYISYNTYPGGHLRDLVRAMMRFHVQHVEDQTQQVGEARALLEFVANAQGEADVYGSVLKAELKRINANEESLVFHDDLAPINEPLYFHEFVTRAAAHDLQFLAEADYFEMQDSAFAPTVADTLRHVAGGERILQEQYADFLKGRRFRQTLLCHRSHTLTAVADLAPFSVASSVTPAAPAEVASATAEVEFRNARGLAMTTNHPLLKAAMQRLAQAWSRAMPFTELLATAHQQSCISASLSQTSTLLSEMLLKVYGRNLLSLHMRAPQFAAQCGVRPRASALARLQSIERSMVTNLRHENVELTGPLARKLLPLLDGSRTRQNLLDELAHGLGVLSKSLATELEEKLSELVKLALIEAV